MGNKKRGVAREAYRGNLGRTKDPTRYHVYNKTGVKRTDVPGDSWVFGADHKAGHQSTSGGTWRHGCRTVKGAGTGPVKGKRGKIDAEL